MPTCTSTAYNVTVRHPQPRGVPASIRTGTPLVDVQPPTLQQLRSLADGHPLDLSTQQPALPVPPYPQPLEPPWGALTDPVAEHAHPRGRPSKRRNTRRSTRAPPNIDQGVHVPVVLVPSLATLAPPEALHDGQPPGQPSSLHHATAATAMLPTSPPRRRSRAARRQGQRSTCRRVLAAAAACLSPGTAPLLAHEQQAVASMLQGEAGLQSVGGGAAEPVKEDDVGECGNVVMADADAEDVLSLPDVTAALFAQLEGLQQAAQPPHAGTWPPPAKQGDSASTEGVQEALQLKRSLTRLARLGDHAQLVLLLGFLLQAPAPTYGALHASQIAAAVQPLTMATNALVADAARQLLRKWKAAATDTALVCAKDARLGAGSRALRDPARGCVSALLGVPMAMAHAAEGVVQQSKASEGVLAVLDSWLPESDSATVAASTAPPPPPLNATAQRLIDAFDWSTPAPQPATGDPTTARVKHGWSEREHRACLGVVRAHGKDWRRLQAALPNRSLAAIKNYCSNHRAAIAAAMAEYHSRLQVEGPAAGAPPDPPEALLIEPTAPEGIMGGWRSASGLLTSPGESVSEAVLHTPTPRHRGEGRWGTPVGASSTPGASALLVASFPTTD